MQIYRKASKEISASSRLLMNISYMRCQWGILIAESSLEKEETVSREPKGKGKKGSTPNQTPHQIKPKIRFAVKVLDREWTGDPIITSIPQIMNALRDDKTIPGNLIFSADPQVVDEVKQIWSAYELRDEMTVAIIAPPNSVGPTVSIWWTSDKKKPMPYRYKAQIHQITDFEGPVPKPAQLVQLLNSQGPKLETVRLLAPAHFRSHIAGVDTLDTPVSIISEWSKLLGVSVAKLTGGNWQKLAHPKGQLLVAHLRLSQDLAEKICGLSGTPPCHTWGRCAISLRLAFTLRPKVWPWGFTSSRCRASCAARATTSRKLAAAAACC